MLAQIGAAPTNWHQATSKAEEDAEMRKMAPLMYVAGVLMVTMQVVAAVGVTLGMVHPSCVTNNQCIPGLFCQMDFGAIKGGGCLYCGEQAPLVQYWSAAGQKMTGYGPKGLRQLGNFASSKAREPIGFAGFNDTHVKAVCTRPFKDFAPWEVKTETRELLLRGACVSDRGCDVHVQSREPEAERQGRGP